MNQDQHAYRPATLRLKWNRPQHVQLFWVYFAASSGRGIKPLLRHYDVIRQVHHSSWLVVEGWKAKADWSLVSRREWTIHGSL